MLPRRIAAGVPFGAPAAGYDERRLGRCLTLYVRVTEDVYESAWEPTPEELNLLAVGGSVILRIVGGQPPVALYVEPFHAET